MSRSIDFEIIKGVLNKYRGKGKDVVIPDSVTTIGDTAFYGCKKLKSITIKNSVTSIGCHAFFECSSLSEITIPDSVTNIGTGAFEYCKNIKRIIIPASVTSIGVVVFNGCENLESIVVDPENTVYDSREDCNAIIETASDKLIASCEKTIIPDSVTSIGDDAFYGCKIFTDLTIPDSVTSIGEYAFFRCINLTSITIPDSVVSIERGAFSACEGLKSISIPDGVTSIGDRAFSYCKSLTSITIPNSVTSIGKNAFSVCESLESINVPDSVTSLGACVFKNCERLESVTIGSGVTCIDKEAFKGCCSLSKVILSDSVKKTEKDAYEDCPELYCDQLNKLPKQFRRTSALNFIKRKYDLNTEVGKVYAKYIQNLLLKKIDEDLINIEVISFLCEHRFITVKNIDSLIEEAQKTDDFQIISALLDYKGTKLNKKAFKRIEAKKEKDSEEVFERALDRMEKEGINGLNFAVAGRLKTFANRDELKTFLSEKGANFSLSVSPKVDYLITNDIGKITENIKKATELGIEVITEDYFKNMI